VTHHGLASKEAHESAPSLRMGRSAQNISLVPYSMWHWAIINVQFSQLNFVSYQCQTSGLMVLCQVNRVSSVRATSARAVVPVARNGRFHLGASNWSFQSGDLKDFGYFSAIRPGMSGMWL
jgi:hypothetical protein